MPDIVTTANSIAWFQNDVCPPGTYSPNGTLPCFQCSQGMPFKAPLARSHCGRAEDALAM